MKFSRLLALFWAVTLAALAADRSFVIVLIGPTGSGKTTQAAFLARRYGLPTIATDDLIKHNPQAMAKYQTPASTRACRKPARRSNDLVHDRLSRWIRRRDSCWMDIPRPRTRPTTWKRW